MRRLDAVASDTASARRSFERRRLPEFHEGRRDTDRDSDRRSIERADARAVATRAMRFAAGIERRMRGGEVIAVRAVADA